MKVIFAKYNRTRLPKYQIVTSILRDGEQLKVEKRALRKEAVDHILSLFRNYEVLKNNLTNIEIVPLEINADTGDTAVFPYIYGKSYESLLLDYALKKDENGFFEVVEDYKNLLYELGNETKPVSIPGYTTEESYKCLKVSNLDFTFDNVLLAGERKWLIDYEWVFDWSIPIDYLLYRSVYLFFWKHKNYMNNFITFSRMVSYLGYSKEENELFNDIEKKFQETVVGENFENDRLKAYKKQVKTLVQLEQDLLKSKNDNAELVNKLEEFKIKLVDSERSRIEIQNRFELNQKNLEKIRKIAEGKSDFIDEINFDALIDNYKNRIQKLYRKLAIKDQKIKKMEEQLDLQQKKLEEILIKKSGLNNITKELEEKRKHFRFSSYFGKDTDLSSVSALRMELEHKNLALEMLVEQNNHLKKIVEILKNEADDYFGYLTKVEEELININGKLHESRIKLKKIKWLEYELSMEKEENKLLRDKQVQLRSELEILKKEMEETTNKYTNEIKYLKNELERVSHLHHIKSYQLKELEDELNRLRRTK